MGIHIIYDPVANEITRIERPDDIQQEDYVYVETLEQKIERLEKVLIDNGLIT